jgi:LPXTG-site transpeptidase (sortase) family protein
VAAERRGQLSPTPRERAALVAAVVIPAVLAAMAVLALGGDDSKGPPPLSAGSLRAIEPGAGASPIIARSAGRGRSGDDRLEARALAPRPPRPDSIAIPDAGVASPVEPMGARGNSFRLPGPYEVGWYRGGPRPGETGRAVLIGHRDTKTGPGAFAGLSQARPGSLVTVSSGGVEQRYRVTEAVSVAKSSFAAASIYSPGKRPALVLITCGGRFDRETGHYDDNVVVLARQA